MVVGVTGVEVCHPRPGVILLLCYARNSNSVLFLFKSTDVVSNKSCPKELEIDFLNPLEGVEVCGR
jgi:hypothetical protein